MNHQLHLVTRQRRRRGAGLPSSAPMMAPSLGERPACRRAATLASSGERGSRPPAIARSVVGGAASVAHRVPQRQHASSWRAIGASQERHKRGKCRSRMEQRSFPRAVADRGVRLLNRRTALPSLREELFVRWPLGASAERCPATSRLAEAVRSLVATNCIPFRRRPRTRRRLRRSRSGLIRSGTAPVIGDPRDPLAADRRRDSSSPPLAQAARRTNARSLAAYRSPLVPRTVKRVSVTLRCEPQLCQEEPVPR